MTNTGRKKRRKNAVVTMAFRLFFVLLLLFISLDGWQLLFSTLVRSFQ